MRDDIQKQILGAFLVLLKPIARILLRCGIGFREFSELAKTAFVDVASSDYGLRGRPTNISRVAVMTGLTRKEVRRIRDKIARGEETLIVKTTPMSELVHRWHSENEFLDANGMPKRLPFSGDRGTFSSLVRQFGGDIPPGALRTELKRVGAVRELTNGDLEIVQKSTLPPDTADQLTSSIVHGAYPLLSTIVHNMKSEQQDVSWPQITAFTQSVKEKDMPRIRRISRERLKEVSESFDDLFEAYETLHKSDQEEDKEKVVGIGVFYFEDGGLYEH